MAHLFNRELSAQQAAKVAATAAVGTEAAEGNPLALGVAIGAGLKLVYDTLVPAQEPQIYYH